MPRARSLFLGHMSRPATPRSSTSLGNTTLLIALLCGGKCTELLQQESRWPLTLAIFITRCMVERCCWTGKQRWMNVSLSLGRSILAAPYADWYHGLGYLG